MMASTQVLSAEDANEAVIPEDCKPPTGFSQMTVSKICRDVFFECLKKKAEFCVWGKEEEVLVDDTKVIVDDTNVIPDSGAGNTG